MLDFDFDLNRSNQNALAMIGLAVFVVGVFVGRCFPYEGTSVFKGWEMRHFASTGLFFLSAVFVLLTVSSLLPLLGEVSWWRASLCFFFFIVLLGSAFMAWYGA